MQDFFSFPDWQMWVTLFIITGAIVMYSLDRFSLELVSVSILILLLLLFHLAPITSEEGVRQLSSGEILAGFANPALFAILGLLVIGQGMFQAGAMDYPTRLLLKAYAKYQLLVVFAVFAFVLCISALLNNTPVVVMFIPILAAISAQSGLAASRIMMPLSFVSILGGMTTIIGSSTNLLAVQSYFEHTGNEIGFFALAPLGGVLAGVGVLYLVVFSKYFLPDRHTDTRRKAVKQEAEGKQFIAQIDITRGHPLIGSTSIAGLFPDLPDVTVRMVQRRDQVFLPPFDDLNFRLHDTIIVAATRRTLTNLFKANQNVLAGVVSEVTEAPGEANELTMVEAIVAPGSRFIGRSVSQIGFRYQTNCVILGIQRHVRMAREHMSTIRLEAGDVLLILGERSDIRALRADRDIVLLEYSMTNLPDGASARRAAFIFASVVVATVAGGLPVAIAAITGAGAMVVAGCLNIRQAARAIDRRIYLLVGSALAMGTALEKTGGAAYLGDVMVTMAQFGGPVALMSAFFILSAGMTNVLSNNATAVLFTPIAISAAQQAGIDPYILALTVIYGANCSFATPVSYQTNLLVMGPGNYKFRDFLVVGVPLIFLLWISYTLCAPVYFRLTGVL